MWVGGGECPVHFIKCTVTLQANEAKLSTIATTKKVISKIIAVCCGRWYGFVICFQYPDISMAESF